MLSKSKRVIGVITVGAAHAAPFFVLQRCDLHGVNGVAGCGHFAAPSVSLHAVKCAQERDR